MAGPACTSAPAVVKAMPTRVVSAARANSSHFVTLRSWYRARAYTPGVARWVAVGLGCVTALGMSALVELLVGSVQINALHYLGIFGALVIGGYVAGHLAGRHHAFYGAMASVLYIFVTVTVGAIREAPVAREFGLGALPPIDFVQLTLTDVLAMSGASWGGWLAGRF